MRSTAAVAVVIVACSQLVPRIARACTPWHSGGLEQIIPASGDTHPANAAVLVRGSLLGGRVSVRVDGVATEVEVVPTLTEYDYIDQAPIQVGLRVVPTPEPGQIVRIQSENFCAKPYARRECPFALTYTTSEPIEGPSPAVEALWYDRRDLTWPDDAYLEDSCGVQPTVARLLVRAAVSELDPVAAGWSRVRLWVGDGPVDFSARELQEISAGLATESFQLGERDSSEDCVHAQVVTLTSVSDVTTVCAPCRRSVRADSDAMCRPLGARCPAASTAGDEPVPCDLYEVAAAAPAGCAVARGRGAGPAPLWFVLALFAWRRRS